MPGASALKSIFLLSFRYKSVYKNRPAPFYRNILAFLREYAELMDLLRGAESADTSVALLQIDGQSLPGLIMGDRIKFMFSPKEAIEYQYTIKSDDTSIDGKTGCITAFLPPGENGLNPDPNFPNWWTDDPARDLAEGWHPGVKTINKWREEFLNDFKIRTDRCLSPQK